MKKQSGRNLQKKLEKDGSRYCRVKKSVKAHAQKVSRRKLKVEMNTDYNGMRSAEPEKDATDALIDSLTESNVDPDETCWPFR